MAEGACKICGGLHSTGECSVEAKGEKQPDLIKCSEDGKHSIALSHEEGKDVVIIDGKRDEYPWHKGARGERQHNIVDVSVSRNGEHVGLTRQTKEGEFIVLVDKKPAFKFRQEAFDERGILSDHTKPIWMGVTELGISDDGKHWACAARDGNADRSENIDRAIKLGMFDEKAGGTLPPGRGWSVVLDGKIMTRPIENGGHELVISKEGDRFTYVGGSETSGGKPSEPITFYGDIELVTEKVKGKMVRQSKPYHKL